MEDETKDGVSWKWLFKLNACVSVMHITQSCWRVCEYLREKDIFMNTFSLYQGIRSKISEYEDHILCR